MNHLTVFEFFILCSLAVITNGQNSQNNEQTICNRYNIRGKISWTCKLPKDCQWAQNILNTTNEHRCSSSGKVKKICCPERLDVASNVPSNVKKNFSRIARRKCDEYAKLRYQTVCDEGLIGEQPTCVQKMDCTSVVELLVVEGIDAQDNKEFPHMALIGGGSNLDDVIWFCGGSLISKNFILSAAHCTGKGTSREVRWAALGILNRGDATADKLNKNVFEIKRTLNHPKYNGPKTNYDIALYQLKNDVEFSPFIRPICLHTEYNLPSEVYRGNSTITGWGVNETGSDVTDVLQKASISVIRNDLCIKEYASDSLLQKGFDGTTMVCAGDLKSSKDTCSGDSGGPIKYQPQRCLYVQMGITSLGNSFCGTGTPAIYTRVSAFLDWIVNNVWPNES